MYEIVLQGTPQSGGYPSFFYEKPSIGRQNRNFDEFLFEYFQQQTSRMELKFLVAYQNSHVFTQYSCRMVKIQQSKAVWPVLKAEILSVFCTLDQEVYGHLTLCLNYKNSNQRIVCQFLICFECFQAKLTLFAQLCPFPLRYIHHVFYTYQVIQNNGLSQVSPAYFFEEDINRLKRQARFLCLFFLKKTLLAQQKFYITQFQIEMKKPQNYYCHRATNNLSNLPQGYELIEKIGEGAFGQVFKVFNSQTSSIEVMKCTKGEFPQTLNKETEIMSKMETSDGFAKLKDRTNNQDFLIMTLLGENLQSIIERYTINVIDMKRIAYQSLLRLKELHERGYVHRDIKPQNILLGNQKNPHKLYIVDFGLSSNYKKSSQVARKLYQGEIGTIKFCPIASHKCLEQYPKDDLESLGYLLVYLLTKDLPWSRFPKGLDEREKFDRIRAMKEQAEIDKLCGGVVCLKKYFKLVKQLKVGQCIQYKSLLQLFSIPCKENYCFSFCQGSCFAKKKLEKEQSQKQNQLEEGSLTVRSQLHKDPFNTRRKKNL